MKNFIIVFLGISVLCIAQNKTDSPYSTTFTACIKKIPNPNECLEQELRLQDKKLNIAYQKAKKSIQAFRVDTLRKVQRAWIHYRDKKCAFFYHKESGSGGISDALQCELDETIRRTKELETLY